MGEGFCGETALLGSEFMVEDASVSWEAVGHDALRGEVSDLSDLDAAAKEEAHDAHVPASVTAWMIMQPLART
jgi:hypothetical protein